MQKENLKVLVAQQREEAGLSSGVIRGAGDAIVSVMEERNQLTKLSLAKALVRGAAEAGSMRGKEVLRNSKNIKNIADAAKVVHNWNDSGSTQVAAVVNISFLSE
jgi:hypothetical protein